MKIKVQKRRRTGRKTKHLLEEGQMPAVVYGPKRKSLNIKADRKDVQRVYESAGYSRLIDFEVDGVKKTTKVLIREVQFDPVTDIIGHISFFELDMTKPITTEIPLITKGKSKAVEENIGFLVAPMESIEVRCLPEKLPPYIEIDISSLDEIGDSVPVSDLVIPEGVEFDEDVSEAAAVAFIAPPQKEIVEEETEVAEAEEGEEEGEEEEGEGEGEDEGEEKEEVAEEGDQEQKKVKKEK